MPFAEADPVCSTGGLPALPRRTFTSRRSVALRYFVPPSMRGVEFRNSLDFRRVGTSDDWYQGILGTCAPTGQSKQFG